MPGQYQHVDSLRRAAARKPASGVGAIDLFGVPSHRDAIGPRRGWRRMGSSTVALAAVRRVGDALVVCADLPCLDEFTDHGHCGLPLDAEGGVDDDATLPLYQAMAISQARAGAHMVCPRA